MEYTELKANLLSDPKTRAAYDKLLPEFELLRQMLRARQQVGLDHSRRSKR